MTVVDFKPKATKRRKVTQEEALAAFLAEKPRTMLLVGTTGDDLIVFTGGQQSSEVLWLLELAKKALFEGEFESAN